MASEARAPIAQAPMLPCDALVLQLPSGEELTASKAALVLMSHVLHDVLDADPCCHTLKVTGDAEAWRLVLDFPLMTSNARNTRLARNSSPVAELMVKVAELADKYHMPVLLQEWDDYVNAWTDFSHRTSSLTAKGGPSPTTPAWWIDTASRQGCIKVAAPALRALVRQTAYSSSSWRQARQQHVAYGRKQQGSELWGLVCSMLEGCDDTAALGDATSMVGTPFLGFTAARHSVVPMPAAPGT